MNVAQGAISADLLQRIHACGSDAAALEGLVAGLVGQHAQASTSVLNLIASHNRLSPRALALLSSGVAEHIMSGHIGSRDHAGGSFIDAIDSVVVELSRGLFGADTVEYRAMSGAVANGLVLFAAAAPGDTILALPARHGGHYTYREAGYAGVRGLRVVDIPCSDPGGEIELDALRECAKRERPKAIVIGTAWMLAPYPVGALRGIADEVGALLVYDGAHILGLVAGGQFQDPLREGAHVLTGSTQKTLGGPIGGLVLAADRAFGERVIAGTSGLISNYHNNRIAALAVTLAETRQFGRDYAAQTVGNARTLAQALAAHGVPVLGRAPDFTASHVVLIDPTALPDGDSGFVRLEAAGLLATRVPLPASHPARRGLRLGSAAVTRAGMKAPEMQQIAALVARVLLAREAPSRVAAESAALAARFPGVRYCIE